ncbi:PAM68 family protein [Oscillatoria sp. FACHB-1407]|uniref:PAM68 family protein n=1 Tax=Oscillatoria sp. FACHB-1407 TaxID=2692847 RepID=UPI001689B666|nr:PAM68 family protein [Oscillatoria sp. FACHB-1407]MBD2463874.1 PAM68 family protein [Oscillatoria sp. FACHB-1407]
MSSDPQPDSKQESSSRDRLPFEPGKTRKSGDGSAKDKPEAKPTQTQPVKKTVSPIKKKESKQVDRSLTASAIPDTVSRRMVRRMALLCGVPTFLGMSTFFVSYFVVTQHLIELPNVAVVLVSMGFFGLGVLGLTYGVLSASWDEDIPGSVIGWSEFTTNLGRMTEAWRSNKKA